MSDQLSVPSPPVAATVVEYVVPWTPCGKGDAVLIVSAGLVVRFSVVVPVLPPESVAINVMASVPLASGVPVIAPVAGFRVSPACNAVPVMLHV